MQQAIPCTSWQPQNPHTPHSSSSLTTFITININTHASSSSHSSSPNNTIMVNNMALENAVAVFATRGCCMSHVAKRLLLGLGVNPAVHEVDEEDEEEVVRELEAMVGGGGGGGVGKVQFPAVFIGGKLFGGLDRLMATHISGELVPILKQAGALWL